MGKIKNSIVAALAGLIVASAAPATAPASPTDIVQRQVDTFNAGDLDGFVACYSDDVELVALGATTIPPVKGRDAFIARYAPVLRKYHPKVTILSRQVSGAFVVDKERTVGDGRTQDGLAIYEVKDGRIVRVWFTP